MDLWQSVVLALIQGITEFLPISSSGHLVITREFFGWEDAGAAFDAFTGLGTLTAVIIYFRREIKDLCLAFFDQFSCENFDRANARLANQLIIATLPALIIGYLVKDYVDVLTHSPKVIAFTTIFYAVLLYLSDRLGKKIRALKQTSYRDAIIYGFAQALALIPGTSRSGITITAGLALGYDRKSAAKFSFLLSIPISAAAGLYGLLKLLKNPEQFPLFNVFIAYIVSLVSAYFCIALFIRFLDLIGMLPHAIYRLCLGIAIILILV
ncbi:MAG: undecaprenyl-diphosphate phosphatase [Cardiobacteriaceae bacterium]|nr:undecaprenyl-diphosphate phosphatase [Cardiobacteriaceae bacterium]